MYCVKVFDDLMGWRTASEGAGLSWGKAVELAQRMVCEGHAVRVTWQRW